MPISKRVASWLLGFQFLALLVGTQMPNAWRNNLTDMLHAPSGFSSLAHFLLFAGMAAVASAPPIQWPVRRVIFLAITAAAFTELMQFLAVDRHPRFVDVGIDMAGALLGLCLSKAFVWRLNRC